MGPILREVWRRDGTSNVSFGAASIIRFLGVCRLLRNSFQRMARVEAAAVVILINIALVSGLVNCGVCILI